MKKQFLPNEKLPSNSGATKALLQSIGMDFTSYHACPNDCILYCKENANLIECPICQTSQFRKDVQGESVPAKVQRHFLILPRIQTMFKCKSMSSLMTWHQNTRSSDGTMRFLADSLA